MTTDPPTHEQIETFLSGLHGATVSDLEALGGGYWSSAFGYRVGDRELVLRLGTVPEGFEMDREARRFDRSDLPVPEVVDIGDAFGGAYAVSVRHHGRFLESVRRDEADVAGPAIEHLLGALRAIRADPGSPLRWHRESEPVESTWRGWLVNALIDDPARRVSGWRATLAADRHLDRLFRAVEGRVRDLVDACPERRDLVHGDLLHGNVLVAPDASKVTAVFSWKCSTWGDFLFDTAWCTFWEAWHPGIAAADVRGRVLASPEPADADLTDGALRHHCYELHIGATHLGWNAWTGDETSLRQVAAATAEVLERGPL